MAETLSTPDLPESPMFDQELIPPVDGASTPTNEEQPEQPLAEAINEAESPMIKRDWSDTLAQHEEKQAAHTKQYDQKAADISREANARAAKARKEADDAKRAQIRTEARAEYVAKERFMAGTEARGRDMNEVHKDIDTAADRYADQQVRKAMHPETAPRTGNSVNIDSIKADKFDATNPTNSATGEAVKDFYKSFNKNEQKDLDPDEVVSQNQAGSKKHGTEVVLYKPVPVDAVKTEVVKAQPEMARVIAELRQARSEYARIAATRGSRTFTGRGKEFDKDALEAAKKHYETVLDQQFSLEFASAHAAGIFGDECKRLAGVSAMIDASRLAKEIKRHELLATGEYREVTDRNGRVRMGADGQPAIEKIAREGRLEKAGLAVKEFWARNTGGKFFSRKTAKKVATTAAVGIPIGMAAGLAGSVLLGPAAAGAIGVVAATRISKFLASNKLNKYSDSDKAAKGWDNVIDEYDGVRLTNGNGIDFATERRGVSAKAEFGSNLRVKRNRLRAGGMAVSLVAGSLVGHAAEHLLSTIGGGNDHTEAISSGDGDSTGVGTQSDLGKMPTRPDRSGDHRLPNPRGGGSDATPEKPKFEHVSLEHNGDNIWNEVKEHMDAQGYKTDTEHLDRVKDAVLRHQGITEEQARNLPVGYDFGIPLDVLHGIPKK